MSPGRRIMVAIGVVGILFLAGCGTAPCDRLVIELVYDDPFYDFNARSLETAERNGWDCASVGAIRDGFGRSIGTRYECRKC